MAKISVLKGATSVLSRIFVQDSTSTTGAGKTGLTAASFTGTKVYVARDDDGNAGGTAVTLSDSTRGTWSSGGIKEKDATNMPGVYEFGLTNASLATGSRTCTYEFIGTGIAPCVLEIELTGWDNQDAVHGGMSALPNTACTTNASLLTSGTGTAQISNSSGQVILQTGTGTGQLDFTSGVVKSNMVQVLGGACPAVTVTGIPKVDVADWLGTAVTAATAGIPDTNVKNINNTAAATPGASGGVLISGTNSGTTTLAALTVTGSLTVSDGLLVSRSTANSAAATFTGTGSGNGITITGGAAITTTAAGNGLVMVGGAASTGAGGVSGVGVKVTGGAGAASANGAAAGMTVIAGGTTTVSGNDGVTFTGTGNGNGITIAHAGSGQDFNATTTPLTLAKTTNITGFNDITAAAAATGVWQDATAGDFTTASSIGKSLYNAFTANTSVYTVASLANAPTGGSAPTVSQIATAVWQDATAGDFTTASSIGKSLYTSGVVPGGTNGLFIAGTNAATTITTGLTAHIIGTVDTLTTYTGNTVQTGDSYARIGANGAGLTSVGITSNRKKGATATFEFTMQDSTTGADKTGLTVASVISKDGGAFASTSNAVTEVANGWYQLVLTATEMTANNVALQMTATGATARDLSVQTQP